MAAFHSNLKNAQNVFRVLSNKPFCSDLILYCLFTRCFSFQSAFSLAKLLDVHLSKMMIAMNVIVFTGCSDIVLCCLRCIQTLPSIELLGGLCLE